MYRFVSLLKFVGIWMILSLSACGDLADVLNGFDSSSVVSIASLQQGQNPVHQRVRVRGQVVRKVPLPEAFAYELKDETGSILVLTSTSVWEIGTQVTAQGRLQLENMTVGNVSQQEIYLDMMEP